MLISCHSVLQANKYAVSVWLKQALFCLLCNWLNKTIFCMMSTC